MTDEILTLLDRVDPVDRERLRTRSTPEDELQAILAANLTAPPPPRRPLLRRAVPIAAGFAVLLVAGAALLPGEDGGASPEAARALESAAAVAADDVPPAGPGRYSYSRVRQASLATAVGSRGDSYSFYMPRTIEAWIAPNGAGRVRETRDAAEWPGPRDEARWRKSGHSLGWGERATDRRYAPGELDGRPYEEALPPVSELPADPGDLAEVFEDERNESSSSVPLNAKMFEYGISVLLQPASPPELRSATYRVLAGVEGVELVGERRDPLGRLGTEVSITTTYSGDVPERSSLIYDAETAHALAYVQRLTEPAPYIDSRLTGYTVLEESGYVPSVTERP